MTSPGQCIAVASGKGGTGKTSFTAGVGAALALSGRRVLCLDCDIGLRNLALGLSDRTLMDFSDVAQNRCSLELAAVEHPKIPGLFLLTAPARPHGRPVTEIQMADLLREVRRRFDFCLLDAPAGLGRGFQLVNRVRKKLLRQLHATIDDAIDKAGLPLLGVVPEDDALPLCMNRGVPILLADGQSAATAYRNIAKRLQGERVPLLRIR